MERGEADILDEMLVLEAQDGRREAIAGLVERWRPSLLRHAVYLTGDPEQGADAAQEAWVAIIRKLGGLEDPARFGAWAMRIVTNKCRDASRKRRRAGTIVSMTVEPADLAGSEGDASEIDRLRQTLRRLPGDQRALLALRYVDRLSVPRIAGVLGVPEGTVKSRLHQARASLKSMLESDSERSVRDA